MVGERRNAKGYLANKCPLVPQGRVAPPLTWTPNHRLRLQCNVVLMWMRCLDFVQNFDQNCSFFSEAEGSDEGERGGGGCGHGQGAHIQLHTRWFYFCINDR